jgi:TonB-linked SusC/RagA family outer membrane protein
MRIACSSRPHAGRSGSASVMVRAALPLCLALAEASPRPVDAQQSLAVNRPTYVARFAPDAPPDLGDAPVVLRQPITLHLRGVTVERALREVTGRAGIALSYSRSVVPLSRRVSVDVEAGSVLEALGQVLTGTGVELWVSAAGRMVLVPETRRADAVAAAASVRGKVTDAATAQPVVGATLILDGTTTTARTGNEGTYAIVGVAAGRHTVTARMLGFASSTQTIDVPTDGSVTADFALSRVATSLDQVVVTGTAGGELRRSIGNAVSTIDVTDELDRSGVGDVGTLLNGRSPGVIVTAGTGRVGAGPSINIRGKSTLTLSQEPLLYIDGIRVNNDIGTGPNTRPIASRFNDIAPDDIESIEIIKGPAAGTIYGTEGANGVIHIITKKGRAGSDPRWTALLRQGTTYFSDAEARMPTNFGRDASGQILSWNPVAQENARGTPLFRNGRDQAYSLSVSGGAPSVKYYASGSWDQDTGIEPNNGLRRFSGHTNLALTPSPAVDLPTSLNVVKGRTRLGAEFGGGVFQSALFGSPLAANTPTRGFLGAPPEVSWSLLENTQALDRFTGGLQVNHRPSTWLTQRLSLGLDLTTEDNQALQRFALPEQAAFLPPSQVKGSISQSLRQVSFITVDYGASARVALTSTFSSTTSLGAQLYRRRTNTTVVSGRDFPAQGVSTVAATTTQITGSQDVIVNKTVGLYGQEQLSWRDRLFLTGAVRVDNNSAFGKDYDVAAFPKLSASWVISEEPWTPAWLGSLKLRSAFGLSGQQPIDFAALRSYQAAVGTSDQPAVTPQFTGNPELKPERSRELEVGFEAELFGRLSLDFTHFTKRTKDALLSRQVAPSYGFPGTRYVNIGEVSNRGFELKANLQAVSRPAFRWDVGGNIATTADRIEELGGVPFIAFAGVPQRNAKGYAIGGYWSRRVVSATAGPNGVPTNVLCDGGDVSDAPLACAQAPAVYLGTPTPKQVGAGTSTLAIGKRLRLYGMVDFKRGHKLMNVDEWARCTAFRVCEANYRPEHHSPIYNANVQNGGGFFVADAFVQEASFARLRELSVSYELPAAVAGALRSKEASVALVGRNLHTWTDYRGLDPESRSFVNTLNIFDQALTPALTQFLVTVRMGF